MNVAKGSVTVKKDTVIIDLIANTDGVFQYSLDTKECQQVNAVTYQEGECCNLIFVIPYVFIRTKDLQEIPGLSGGKHSLRIQFVASSSLSSKTLKLKPFIDFTVLSKGDFTFFYVYMFSNFLQ